MQHLHRPFHDKPDYRWLQNLFGGLSENLGGVSPLLLETGDEESARAKARTDRARCEVSRQYGKTITNYLPRLTRLLLPPPSAPLSLSSSRTGSVICEVSDRAPVRAKWEQYVLEETRFHKFTNRDSEKL